ncbi:undecaprenyl pyrophosphate phosphatase [Gammaproteobacteria bacterium]
MELTIYLNAIILGLVEGITEFLPISSTGHLIITGNLLGFTGPRADTFEVFIQLGAILAVLWHYQGRLVVVPAALKGDSRAVSFLFNLAVAFLPAAILGFLFHKTIKVYLFSPVTVALALVVGGIAILWVERRIHKIHVEEVDDMGWRDALMVGCAQCLALIPGTSRAGATIIGGLLFGLSRRAATEFSFFLAIPTMFAATLYDLYKSRGDLSLADIPLFSVGFVVAFFSALVVVRALLVYIGRHDFSAFAWYRIVFGGLVLFYSWYFPGAFAS